MKRKYRDLTGQQFGSWTVLERTPSTNKHVKYWCRCTCGTEAKVQSGNLLSGRSTRCLSCGVRAGHRLRKKEGAK